MANRMMITKEPALNVQLRNCSMNNVQTLNCSSYDIMRLGKLIDEVIAMAKGNRINTKHAISADIESTARVQNQNERIIMICEQEMQREDISESRRDEILERMANAAKSTAYANTISKEFQNRYLELSYKQPWKVLGYVVLAVFSSVSGIALLKTAL